jgi:hypothetical protein
VPEIAATAIDQRHFLKPGPPKVARWSPLNFRKVGSNHNIHPPIRIPMSGNLCVHPPYMDFLWPEANSELGETSGSCSWPEPESDAHEWTFPVRSLERAT